MRALALLLIASLTLEPLAGCASTGHPHIDGAPRPENDWARVAKIERNDTITVVLTSGRPLTRTFVTADESALIAFNLASPTLPGGVKRRLRNLASDQPADLVRVSRGEAYSEKHLRLGPDGVFMDGRKVAELDQVLERIEKDGVAEVSRVHRAAGRGVAWGALAGVALGLAITLASCGTDWSEENSSCSNLTPASIFIMPLWGILIGGLVGAATQVSTVVYRAP